MIPVKVLESDRFKRGLEYRVDLHFRDVFGGLSRTDLCSEESARTVTGKFPKYMVPTEASHRLTHGRKPKEDLTLSRQKM